MINAGIRLTIMIIVLLTVIVPSCKQYRYYEGEALIDFENKSVVSLKDRSDTILTVAGQTATQFGSFHLITIFKDKETYLTQASSNSIFYDTLVLKEFDWSVILNSIDSIKTQRIKPSFTAEVIEKDTIWTQVKPPYRDQKSICSLYLPSQIVTWETTAFINKTNPSLVKVKTTDNIIEEYLNATDTLHNQRIKKRRFNNRIRYQ